MSRTGTPFPYVDRRCQARTALIIHMLARRWPPTPLPNNFVFKAKAPGLCVNCGTYFDVGVPVHNVQYGDPTERRRGLSHVQCPNWSDILENLRQESDDRLITHVAARGRNRAGCGHESDDTQVFLLHRSGQDALDGVGTWVCADCARK